MQVWARSSDVASQANWTPSEKDFLLDANKAISSSGYINVSDKLVTAFGEKELTLGVPKIHSIIKTISKSFCIYL
jgi:hypothetical protein